MSPPADLVRVARSLFERGLTPGTSGNVSVRTGDGFVITPTNSCLGRLDVEHLADVSDDGRHRGGGVASKELPLHLALYRARPEVRAVVHLHSPYAVAVSCLADLDPDDAMPAFTGYHALRFERVPLVAYHPPGSRELAEAVGVAAERGRAALLANHGSLAGAVDLESAADAAELLEQSARLMLLLAGRSATVVSREGGAG